MKQAVKELEQGLLFILDNTDNIDDKMKCLNILKFIDTYDISIEILREYKPIYKQESEVKNLVEFIKNYDDDIEILLKENYRVVQYVKKLKY